MNNYLRFMSLCLVLLSMLILFQSCGMVSSGEVFVSDLEELNVLKEEWMPYKRDLSVDGNSLIIGEKWYPKGLGVHANAELSVQIPKGYTYFVAEVGVDDEIPEENPASVRFFVLGDGAVLYESPVLKADMPPRRIHVNIQDMSELVMKVDDAGDGNNSDHADWGNARFVKR